MVLIIAVTAVLGVILGLRTTLDEYKNRLLGPQQPTPQANNQPVATGTVDPAERLKQMARDDNGCIPALNYYYDDEMEVCVRYKSITDEEKSALAIALNYVGRETGLRVIKILQVPCPTCYKVNMAVDDRYFTVRTRNGVVTDQYDVETMGVGSSVGSYTTAAELMYNISSKLMGNPVEEGLEPIEVVWNDGAQELTFNGVGKSLEDNYGSERITNLHAQLVDLFDELDFTTDENNSTSSTQDYDFLIVNDRDFVCNVLLERNPILDNSHLQVACAEY